MFILLKGAVMSSLIDPGQGRYEIINIQTKIKNGEKLTSVIYRNEATTETSTEKGFPAKGFSVHVYTTYNNGTAVFNSKVNALYLSNDVWEAFREFGLWDNMGFYRLLK